MDESTFKITREKHLDHMVKITPFIVCGYLMQCFLIIHFSLAGFATNTLLILGCCLVVMIAGFITYDLKHQVSFFDSSLEISWFGKRKIAYKDIIAIEIDEEEHSFGNLRLICKDNKAYTFYFVDEANQIKSWLQEKKYTSYKIAA